VNRINRIRPESRAAGLFALISQACNAVNRLILLA